MFPAYAVTRNFVVRLRLLELVLRLGEFLVEVRRDDFCQKLPLRNGVPDVHQPARDVGRGARKQCRLMDGLDIRGKDMLFHGLSSRVDPNELHRDLGHFRSEVLWARI